LSYIELSTENKGSQGNAPPKNPECEEFKTNISGDNLILKNTELFNGMSYADLLREWLIWLHSDSPTYRGYRGEICYLHGNISYYYDSQTNIRKQAEKFENKARNTDDKIFRGDIIFSDTPIFVPLINSIYSVNETLPYEGRTLESIADCLFICRRDMHEGGPMWFTIQKKGCPEINLKNKACYVETPSFKMTVTKNSPLRDYFEMPIAPGEHDTVTTGYIAMIKNLPAGEYRLRYGGIGRGGYFTDAVHDFIVKLVEKKEEVGKRNFKVEHSDSGYDEFKPPSLEDKLEPMYNKPKARQSKPQPKQS